MEVMWISLIKGRIKNKKAQERKAQVIINLHKGQEKRSERPDIKILTVVLLIVVFFFLFFKLIFITMNQKEDDTCCQNNCAFLCNCKEECGEANRRSLQWVRIKLGK